jgi:hypothetical protein
MTLPNSSISLKRQTWHCNQSLHKFPVLLRNTKGENRNGAERKCQKTKPQTTKKQIDTTERREEINCLQKIISPCGFNIFQ